MGKDRSSYDGTTPICRCRVVYLGSSIPHATKDGLEGIQEPLRDLYPESGRVDYESAGIDSWISVWSNGILIENVDDSRREVKKFFPIESLHFCSAVRYVVMPSIPSHNNINGSVVNTLKGTLAKINSLSPQQPTTSTDNPTEITPSNKINNYLNLSTIHQGGDKNYDQVVKFLPLDSPFLRGADNSHLPLFACILRRTTGIKVLECHAFICKHESAANALVRCCFHAYADSMYAKQIEENPYCHIGSGASCVGEGSPSVSKKSRSVSALDAVEKSGENWNDSKQLALPHDILELPSPPPSPHVLKTNDHINHNLISSEIDASFVISQPPDLDNYKSIRLHGAPPLLKRHCQRKDTINTMRHSRIKPPIHMSPSPISDVRGGGPLCYPVMIGNHPMSFSIPIPINDRNADKLLKHSLKKQKKSSKSKMDSIRSSLLVGSGPLPFPAPVNFFHMPQMSPYQSSPRYSMHHSLPPPSHQQHCLQNTIYGPLPGLSTIVPPPLFGPTAYSMRTRLKRGHSTKVRLASGDYSHIFTGPEEEPSYIPTMRPLTPLNSYHGHHPGHPNYPHHTRRPSQQTTSHYVSYPVNYGTTLKHDEYQRKDKITRNSQSVLGGISLVNCGSSYDKIRRGKETERDLSPSAVGLYKRKGHINERAFSYSIRQEHRSISNSSANLTADDSPAIKVVIDSSGDSGSSRRKEEYFQKHYQRSQHHSKHAVNEQESRKDSPSDEKEWVQSSAHSSGQFDSLATTNDEHYDGLRDSFPDYATADQENEVLSLSESMANLKFTDQMESLESKNIHEITSIKENFKQRNNASVGLEITSSLPAQIHHVSSHMVEGESFETKSTRKL